MVPSHIGHVPCAERQIQTDLSFPATRFIFAVLLEAAQKPRELFGRATRETPCGATRDGLQSELTRISLKM